MRTNLNFNGQATKCFHFITGRLSCSDFLFLFFLSLLGSPLFSNAAETDTPVAKLDRNVVEARSTQSALLSVNAFGRYAVTASSAQGVALQLIDRMAGAGVLQGEAGKQDGRLDLFLDRGEYKILTLASDLGKGKVKLAAHAFRELQEHPPLLVEHRFERSSLNDFEQRSYWIEIKEKRVVALEAAGRHLADLRLWRDGSWLVDATPQMTLSQAKTGQPLFITRLTTELNPGLYLLTAYGGPGQTWTEPSEENPFYLRFGIPTIAPTMRQQFIMSEFGTDRFLVPAGPNYFRLELPIAQPASLQVGNYAEHTPFQDNGASVNIDKRTVPPFAELDNIDSEGVKLVTVSMEPGKSYILQNFATNTTLNFKASGAYWISSIHAGYMDDSVGASAILTSQKYLTPEQYLNEQVVELEEHAPWHRKFNLLGEVTLFVKMPESGKLRVVGSGVNALYRFEPFLTSRSANYQTPAWRESGFEFDLDRGLYVLTIEPQTKGILDLNLLPFGSVQSEKMSPINPVVRFSSIMLQPDTNYTMYLNHQPGVTSGAFVRPLPINLDIALPVTQRIGETLTIPVLVSERGTIQALTEDGSALQFALDNGKSGAGIEVEAGQYNVTIKGGDKVQSFALKLEPLRLASNTPLPAVPDAKLAGLPKFPVITPDTPRFVDINRRSSTTSMVRVDTPGLYQFESTGLLHTKGTVRTRTNPLLFEGSENGIGSNFLIQRYLREGDYQLSVTTLGKTQGDLGMQVARSDVIDGGELREGQAAHALLPMSQAIAYQFQITARGTYHLQTLGLGRNFDIRLEDAGGWPVGIPVSQGDITMHFDPAGLILVHLQSAAIPAHDNGLARTAW